MYNTSICNWAEIPDGQFTAPHPFCATGSSANNSATLEACCRSPIAPYDGRNFSSPGTGCYVYCNVTTANITQMMDCMSVGMDPGTIQGCGTPSAAVNVHGQTAGVIALALFVMVLVGTFTTV